MSENSLHAYLVNLTPHTVHIYHPGKSIATDSLKSEGVARATEIVEQEPKLHWCVFGDCGVHDHIPLVRKRFGNVEGLPAAKPNVAYIVSQIVADACPDRDDLLVPHDMVRDAHSRIIGCRGFSRPARSYPDVDFRLTSMRGVTTVNNMTNKEDGFHIPAGSLLSIDEALVPTELLNGGISGANVVWSYDDKRSNATTGRNVYRSIRAYAGARYYMIIDDTATTYATEA